MVKAVNQVEDWGDSLKRLINVGKKVGGKIESKCFVGEEAQSRSQAVRRPVDKLRFEGLPAILTKKGSLDAERLVTHAASYQVIVARILLARERLANLPLEFFDSVHPWCFGDWWNLVSKFDGAITVGVFRQLGQLV